MTRRMISQFVILLAAMGCANATSNRRDGTETASADDGASDQSAISNSAAQIPVPLAGVNVADISRVEIKSACLVADCSQKFFQPNIVMKSGVQYIVTKTTSRPLGVSKISWTSSKTESCSKDAVDPYSRTCEGPAGSPLKLSLSVSLIFASGGNAVVGSLVSDPDHAVSPMRLYLSYGSYITTGSFNRNYSGLIYIGPEAADVSCSIGDSGFLARSFPGKTIKWFSPVWTTANDLGSRVLGMGVNAVENTTTDEVFFSAPVYLFQADGAGEIQERLAVAAGLGFAAGLSSAIDGRISDSRGTIIPGVGVVSGWFGDGCSGWTEGNSGTLVGPSLTFGVTNIAKSTPTCTQSRTFLCLAAVY